MHAGHMTAIKIMFHVGAGPCNLAFDAVAQHTGLKMLFARILFTLFPSCTNCLTGAPLADSQ
jgi:hypothetical protein